MTAIPEDSQRGFFERGLLTLCSELDSIKLDHELQKKLFRLQYNEFTEEETVKKKMDDIYSTLA